MRTRKFKSLYCVACGAVATLNGFCYICNKYIKENKLDIKDKKECVRLLKKYHSVYREKKQCVYCSKPVRALNYCSKHYAFLYRQNIDMRDVEKCVEALKIRDSKAKGSYNTCIFCGEQTRYKNFCANHYKQLKRRNIDINNIELCLEKLKIWSNKHGKKEKD